MSATATAPAAAVTTAVAHVSDIAAAKKRTLFDIGVDFAALDELIEDLGGDISNPAVESAITQWFAEVAGDESRKLSNYVAYIRQLEMEATCAKLQSSAFAAKRQSRESRIAWMKMRLMQYLMMTNRTKVSTADGTQIAVQSNGGKMPIEIDPIPLADLPDRFVSVVRQLNRDAIEAAIESGEELSFARAIPRGTHLRIR